jgi:RNA polymerase subunit RPABC4/transcription elongation factor Spt4
MCERCAAIFQRKTWRSGRKLTGTLLERTTWTVCPACAQTKGRDEYYGKVVVRGLMGSPTADQVLRRIQNVGRRAEATQPEHRVLSLRWNDDVLQVLTTSQKVAHRIAHELKKAFGGTATYSWADRDGTLLAVWKTLPPARSRVSSPKAQLSARPR